MKFLGQIKHFSLQIKRDESLTKRFNPVQIKVEICVTLHFIPSPTGLDTKQTRGNMATDTVKFSFSGFENLVVEVFEVRIQYVGCENARKI